MENKNSNLSNATFTNPTSVRVSKDQRYIIIALPGNILIRKPTNYFRVILNNIANASENAPLPEKEEPGKSKIAPNREINSH